MAYDVSSWFNDALLQKTPPHITRKFTIGNSDYSSQVMKWPSFRKAWNDIRPINATVKLANAKIIGNLLTYSEQFDHADWLKYQPGVNTITVTANDQVGPDGAQTADKIDMFVDGSNCQLYQNMTVVDGANYANSVWFKWISGGDSSTKLRFHAASTPYTNYGDVDLSQYFDGNWHRVLLSAVKGSDGLQGRFNLLSQVSVVFAVVGAQVHKGDRLLPYVKTEASARSLGNEFDFFHNDKTELRKDCKIKFGFQSVTENGVSFDGVNDDIRITDDPALEFVTGDFSIEVWFKANSIGDQRNFIHKGAGAGLLGYRFGWQSNGAPAFLIGDASGFTQNALGVAGSIVAGKIYHLVINFDRSANATAYVNSIVGANPRDITSVPGAMNNPDPVEIADSYDHFDGVIYHVREYDRVLTADEIHTNYKNGHPYETGGAILDLKLDEGSGTLAADSSSNGNDGTLTNGPVWVEDFITLFAGKTERVHYSNEQIDITIVDKFKQLTERVVGTSDVPVSYIGSDYLPSDLVWYAITSYGGYSNVASTSNPDINYTDFLAWAAIFSGDSVFMEAEFTGQKVAEILRKFGRHTYSAIFIKEDKISFHRFGIADASVSSFDNSNIDDLELAIDDVDMVNKQYVSADYNVTSDQWAITAIDQASGSVNSYGLREHTESDKNIWYVNSVGALNMAQRMTTVKSEPYDKITLKTFLPGMVRIVGESINVVDSFHNIDQTFRIMSQRIDIDRGLVEFDADRSQFSNEFILDTSSLGGADVLT